VRPPLCQPRAQFELSCADCPSRLAHSTIYASSVMRLAKSFISACSIGGQNGLWVEHPKRRCAF
jgi:hypothetical protein